MRNKNKSAKKQIAASFLLAVVFLALFLCVLPQVSQAAGLVPCGTNDEPSRCNLCYLIVGFQRIFDYGVKVIAIPITLACITFAGIMYLVSSGNESLVTSAKNFIKASLAGFALILCAWLIVNSIIYFLSANPGVGMTGSTNWWTFNYTCTSTP